MKTFLAFIFFGAYGLWWPYWIGGRTRGNVTLLCIATPILAFLFGWFGK